jgi:hypothetical protein
MSFGTRHRDEEIPRGVTLIINGTLIAADGQPLALTGATLEWALTGEASPVRPVIRLPGAGGEIIITDPTNGLCQIVVDAAATAALAPGRYMDMLRVTIGEVVSPLWRGTIVVDDSPFEAAI